VHTEVVVNSLAISKNSSKFDFQKYNIEVSLEEIENRVTSNKLNYGLTLLSNPKNVRISIEGTTSISGTEQECIQALEKDENGIPRVLHLIYQDIFPTIFMTAKVVGAPCPAYRLSHISAPTEIPESEISSEEQVSVEDEKSSFGQMNPNRKGMEDSTETETVAESVPEQPVSAPQKPSTPEQPVSAPQKPSTPEQPVSEKKPEEMSLNELNQLYAKLGSEYQNDPSGEIGEKIQNVSDLIQKRQQEQMITESSM